MDLFGVNSEHNILPFEGTVNYFGSVLTPKLADHFYHQLLNTIDWKNDEARIFGKQYITKRKVAWYGDLGYSYAYSNSTKVALPWTQDLLELKRVVEDLSGFTFNSCLLNLYHSGDEAMGWHSDDEKSLGKNSCIASLSLGAERKFSFKHKNSGQTVSLDLEHGSLLLMKNETQTYWLHRLNKSTKIKNPRVNLTFRTFVG
ncbi:MAG: alpha-ketoglutarate-dependent dioxygenase AlkB [Sphingobacteriales bacterium]|jgi:alkylated DNA repair dioxygenase AlkB|nr:alpha-ketoglutarate-dependent dioxygenase AlkB [Sphingobacteriales bacterium]